VKGLNSAVSLDRRQSFQIVSPHGADALKQDVAHQTCH
jgi:hypothetical protein